MPKIAIKNMSFVYNSPKDQEVILDNINLNIEQGEFVCIVGHSGCGKTTLLNLIAGLLLPSTGTVMLDGELITGPDTDRAIVFQHYSLFPWMSAQKNVSFAAAQANKSLSREEADTIASNFLQKVGMENARHKYPFQLSGGMSQRVAIAKALAMDAEVLLLDEPFGALDTLKRQELQALLSMLWLEGEPQKTVVFVTHDIDEALLLSNRVIFMQPGKIIRDIHIPFAQPRDKEDIFYTPEYRELKQQLLALFNLNPELNIHAQK